MPRLQLLLLPLLLVLVQPHIYSTTPTVTYNYLGYPSIYHLYFSLETGIGATDYLQILWGEQIYTGSKSTIVVNLVSYSNSLQVASTTVNSELASGTNSYFVTFGYAMQSKTWYELQIYPTKTPTVTPNSLLVQLYALSTFGANPIIYDSNMALGYVDFYAPLASSNTLGLICNSSSAQSLLPSSIYSYDIYLTPTISSATGGNFTISIYYDSTNINHSNGSPLIDFSFMGLCQAAPTVAAAAVVISSCLISSDLSTITFSMPTVVAGQVIRISTTVSNPVYFSLRGAQAYWTQFISGKVYENKQVYNAFSVSKIPIGLIPLNSGRIYLFWGIDKDLSDGTVTGLYLYKAGSANIGPYNSFNAGFTFAQTSPITGNYTVTMSIGATGVLEGSIAHNLPALQGASVVCKYVLASSSIVCTNVGAFIRTAYRYFISGKAYFSTGTSSPITTFGDVSITPVVYDSNGNLLPNVLLYTPLVSGQPIIVKTSQDFLDTSGYHNINSYKVGNTQVVSYADDESLSSTSNAVSGFLQGTTSTVGVVPSLAGMNGAQQLLFLMNVPTSKMSSVSEAGKSYLTQVLFNNQAIGFEAGASTQGLDFVGYQTGTNSWSISYSSCYSNGVVCEKYSTSPPVYNTKTIVGQSNANNFYGLYNFNCGSTYNPSPTCSSNCASECALFTGYSAVNYGSGVMAMRQVVFNSSSFQTSLYADSTLLDFLFIFKHGSTVVSYSLINAYTLTGVPLQNIKAAYVNYFDSLFSGSYNKGMGIPMLLRIGGGVLPSESLNATIMGLFFDDAVDASTFYTSSSSFSLGCSTGSCVYYPNLGLSNVRNDFWITNRAIIVNNMPAIQNEFNILIPVTPDATTRTPPKTLTIAFFTNDYSIGDATQLLRTISVYRVFGAAVTASIASPISSINGLARTGSSTPDINLAASNFYTSGGNLGVSLNTTNMYSNPTQNTFTYGNPDPDSSFGTTFGAGYTITSLTYNIFASSTVQFDTTPPNSATTCTQFGFRYNQIQSLGSNTNINGQWFYLAFCPIDGTFNLQSSAANINFFNPQYPTVFTNNFPLNSILTIAYSNQAGNFRSYRKETSVISTLVWTCTTAKLNTYNPSSTGKQRATFTLSLPAILMAPAANYAGYPSFQVFIAIPSSTVTGSGLQMSSTQCDVSIAQLSCSVISGGNSVSTTLQLTYTGTTQLTVTYLQLGLYATVSGALNAAAAYTVTVYLPQTIASGASVGPYGTLYTAKTTYCTCSSSFTVGITAYGSIAALSNFVTTTFSNSAASPLSFNFGASSYRDSFYISSYFNFNFGFLSGTAAVAYMRNNLRCLVYQGSGNTTLSSIWASFNLATLSSASLVPKAEITNPAAISFTMVCYGSTSPSGSVSTPMSMTWADQQPATFQTSPSLSLPTSFLGSPSYSATVTINSKRFRTEGSKTLYSFTITCSQAMTINTRIYMNFHMGLSSQLDNEGYVECYTRSTLMITDTDALYTYCSFTSPWQLVIWNNRVLAANAPLYLDVFNVDQPKQSDITATRYITVAVDADGNYMNGISATAQAQDNVLGLQAKTTTNTKDITILSATMSSNFIRTSQTITISFQSYDTLVFNGGNKLYVLFPSSYAQWISRSTTLNSSVCQLIQTGGAGTNLASGCMYISQRILQITVSSITQSLYTLTLHNILAPSTLPSGKLNQYHFKLFCADAAQNYLTYFSFSDLSPLLTLVSNPLLIDLSWNYYSIAIIDSKVTLTPLTNQVISIKTGYYSTVIELRQSIYPSNFKATLTLILQAFSNDSFSYFGGSLTATLGKPTAYFRIAANPVVSPGLYTLQFAKTGDSNGIYTNVPPLTLVVQNTLCALTTDAVSYTIPLGGSTLPITIDASLCIPLSSFNISVSFSSGELSLNADLSTKQLTSASADGKIYLVVRHTPGVLTVGSVVTGTFTLTGPSAAYYAAIPSVQFNLVDSTTFMTFPTATSLANPVLSSNKATFTLQCSSPSTIYWGLGIYPSLLNTQAVDLQARIISALNGLNTNFTELNDYYGEVYGFNYGSTMQVITKTLYNLQSNANYIFKYYCMNQLSSISDGQTISFTSLNYGAYLMKVSITFRSAITYRQYNNLACSLASGFVIPFTRVMTQAMSSCTNSPYIFYPTDASLISNLPDSSGNYVYGFYILPDYTIPNDPTNTNIRSALSLNSFTTSIITSTANYISLPFFIQMQTQDIQVFTAPSMSVTSPISGLNSVIISGTITNMNGFIVVGVYNGTYNQTSMTLPTATNIKQGLFSLTEPLLATQMIYATQNYNITFQFGGLTANTLYTFFYFCTAEDPELTSLASTVQLLTAKTLQVLLININYGVHVLATAAVTLLLLVI